MKRWLWSLPHVLATAVKKITAHLIVAPVLGDAAGNVHEHVQQRGGLAPKAIAKGAHYGAEHHGRPKARDEQAANVANAVAVMLIEPVDIRACNSKQGLVELLSIGCAVLHATKGTLA